jgi:hypothetical protein
MLLVTQIDDRGAVFLLLLPILVIAIADLKNLVGYSGVFRRKYESTPCPMPARS